MPNYNIRIVVEGVDHATAPLRNIGSALGNMGQIAGGIIGAGLFMKVAQGIGGIITNSIMATAGLEAMQVSMEGLLAREISVQNNTALMADGIDDATQSFMTISDALPIAGDRAKAMMDELARIAILSPYQLSAVQSTFQMALAFGYTSTEAKDFTKSILNLGAAVGADNERLQRIVYNFAQMRMAGKMTALDVRQLAMAGFDLRGVLQYVGKELGIVINDHNDFNKALENGQVTWEQFNQMFTKYADENFGGAAERMSRTLMGLQSTMKDVFTLTMPAILAPAVSRFTEFANGILNNFLKIRESPALPAIGEKIGALADRVFDSLEPITTAMGAFFDTIGRGVPVMGALGAGIKAGFGMKAWQAFINLSLAVKKFWASTLPLRNSIARIATAIGTFLSKNVKLKDILITLGIILATIIVPALLSLAATVITTLAPIFLIIGAVVLLRKAWESNFMGIQEKAAVFIAWIKPLIGQLISWFQVNLPLALAWLSNTWTTVLLPALQVFWNWVQTVVFPLILQLWTWLQINIPLAIAWLSNAWTTVLLPALQTFWNWVQTVVIPLILQLWAWLQVNLPIAIAFLSNLWTTVLLPAITAIWTFISGSLIPMLMTVWTWLQTNLPIAINFLSTVWNTILLPAITAVWNFLSGSIIPLFLTIGRLIGTILNVALTALAGLWQNVILPAIQAVWGFISSKLQPIFTSLFGKITQGKTVLQTISDFINNTFKPALEGIGDAVGKVIDWIQGLIDKIANIKLPDFLTPGSPTPFENALVGIGEAIHELNKAELPQLKSNLDLSNPNIGANNQNRGGNDANQSPITVQVTTGNIATEVDVRDMAQRIAREIQSRQKGFSY